MAFALMLIVVVPVFVMVVWFAVRYRASNVKADYRPAWANSVWIERVIWTVPLLIVIALSYLTWTKTHRLDPYRPIASAVKPLHIDVVSLDWNWLFIYPDYGIAAVNELVLPANVPLSFRLTSASVMTSFFIPRLGSQMYAMAGMQTRLHLMADEPGTYRGRNLEFSGHGYADMHFDAVVKTPEKFDAWLGEARQSSNVLDMAAYEKLSAPQARHPETVYTGVVPGLFDHVLKRYRGWMGGDEGMKMPYGGEGARHE